ncbi:MAG: TerB family tellurite resistance protein [Calditrichae bacterium]|nr:TerB family tellurite resistance protein [Calditrichota bacterium]MCB9057607.1 TerB family tellurite resistance protein [Calditrichia bacterium]
MLTKLQNLLDNLLAGHDYESEDSEYDLKIATCVLFLELAYADFNLTDEEEKQLRESLRSFFKIDDHEVDELIETAKKKRQQRTDIWLFTNNIKSKFDREEKIKIIEMLWNLVYADGYMDKYEEALMRKISNLLGLSHGEMIQAKLKAANNG